MLRQHRDKQCDHSAGHGVSRSAPWACLRAFSSLFHATDSVRIRNLETKLRDKHVKVRTSKGLGLRLSRRLARHYRGQPAPQLSPKGASTLVARSVATHHYKLIRYA